MQNLSSSSWVAAARLLWQAGEAEAALAVLETAALALPEDARPLIGRIEVAAMGDDYLAARYAMQDLVRHGAPDVLTACLTDDADVAFRLAQLWVSVDGRDRRSRIWLGHCLDRMDWYVPPQPSGYTPESYAQAVAPTLRRLSLQPPHGADALTLWRDWLHPTDGPEMRGEVLASQAGAHSSHNWGAARLIQLCQAARDATRLEDGFQLFDLFVDDGAFGVLRFRLPDGEVVTWDQIISARDLSLLCQWVGLTPADTPLLVDIGAGYGRLVHRFLQAFPSSYALALDSVPGTSAMAELYLATRGCAGRVEIDGPRRLLAPLPPGRPRIATNIHSWSEAPLISIEAWLEALATAQIDWLLLATHDESAVTLELDGPHQPMLPAFLAGGWTLVHDQPRFPSIPFNTGYLRLFRRG